jgi:hypothetical protein
MKETEQKETKNRNMIVTFRIFQAVFFGMLALGISSMFGDVSSYMKSPFSTFSITTTVFGLIGAIITGRLAKNCKDW